MEKVFRDPVHNLIKFERTRDALVLKLIDTAQVQRLRNIRQLGAGSIVYPSATHSRFSHALGTAFLMKRVLEHLIELAPPSLAPILISHRELLLAAALLHDAGHLPFSHLLEDFSQIPHETWTVRIVRHPQSEVQRILTEANPRYPEQIAQLFNRTFKPAFAVKLLSSQLDVDRMEYLLRDSLCTGVTYGYFDVNWLIHSLQLVQENNDWELAIDWRKGLHAAEGYVLARYYMYQQVYHHKTGRAADVLMRKMLQRAADLLRTGYDLPAIAPLRKLLLNPKDLSVHDHLALDDTVMLYAVKSWCGVEDGILSDLAQRFQQRRLFKTLEIEESHYQSRVDELAQITRDAGFDPRYYLALDRAADDPYRESYFLKALLAGENIFLLDGKGELVELSQASDVIRALRNKTYSQDRLCFPEELRERVTALLSK